MDRLIIQSKNGIVITPYEKGQSQTLENFTSTYDRVYHKRIEETGFVVDNYNRVSSFLTHRQSAELIKSEFESYEIIKRPVVIPIETSPFMMTDDFTLKPVQKEVASKVINSLGKQREWFINLQTATGKTLLLVYLTSKIHYRTLVFCFLTDVLNQWQASYATRTTLDSKRIKFLNSRSALYKIMSGDDCEEYDIFVATPNIISSFCKKYGFDKLDIFCRAAGIGTVIFDEAHRNMGFIVRFNALTNIMYTLYLSADFGQGNHKREEKYYRLFYNVPVIKPSEEEEISLKYTDIIIVDYDSKPSALDAASIQNRYGYSAQNYMAYQLKKGGILKVIEYVLSQVGEGNMKKYRTLILVTNVDHADQITEHLAELYKSKLIVGRFHGSVPDSEKTATLEFADIIVSTYLSFGTGRDVDSIKYVIGLNQSNKIEDNQAAGRARPLKDGSRAKYIMVVDKGFGYCAKKLNTRLAYLRQTKAVGDPIIFHYRGDS